MKILFDISVLGSGYYNESVRTGVSRVKARLVIRLPASGKNMVFPTNLMS
jgi:hypothetical protein